MFPKTLECMGDRKDKKEVDPKKAFGKVVLTVSRPRKFSFTWTQDIPLSEDGTPVMPAGLSYGRRVPRPTWLSPNLLEDQEDSFQIDFAQSSSSHSTSLSPLDLRRAPSTVATPSSTQASQPEVINLSASTTSHNSMPTTESSGAGSKSPLRSAPAPRRRK